MTTEELLVHARKLAHLKRLKDAAISAYDEYDSGDDYDSAVDNRLYERQNNAYERWTEAIESFVDEIIALVADEPEEGPEWLDEDEPSDYIAEFDESAIPDIDEIVDEGQPDAAEPEWLN